MRSFDYKRIEKILKHHDIYHYITDDGSPSIDDYELVGNDSIYYLMWEGGLYTYMPQNYINYDVHACVLPEFRGKSLMKFKEANQWMIENTDCLKITAQIPIYNKIALAYAESAGFEHEGINTLSFLKRGVVYDQYRLGLCHK